MKKLFLLCMLICLSITMNCQTPNYHKGGVILGSFNNDPTGLRAGQLYWNTTTSRFRQFNGTIWQDITADVQSPNGNVTRVINIDIAEDNSPQAIAFAVNNSPQFTIEDNEVVYLIVPQNHLGFEFITTLHTVVLKDLGKGTYGTGGSPVTANNITIIATKTFNVDVTDIPSTQTIILGEIGVTAIETAFNAMNPAITIQGQDEGYVLIQTTSNGEEKDYLFVNVGGLYGVGGDLVAVEDDFVLVDYTQPPNDVWRNRNGTVTAFGYNDWIRHGGNVNLTNNLFVGGTIGSGDGIATARVKIGGNYGGDFIGGNPNHSSYRFNMGTTTSVYTGTKAFRNVEIGRTLGPAPIGTGAWQHISLLFNPTLNFTNTQDKINSYYRTLYINPSITGFTDIKHHAILSERGDLEFRNGTFTIQDIAAPAGETYMVTVDDDGLLSSTTVPAGGGGGVGTLQQVTDLGDTTNNTITVDLENTLSGTGFRVISNNGNGSVSLGFTESGGNNTGAISMSNNLGGGGILRASSSGNVFNIYSLPEIAFGSYRLPISVNNQFASSNGNISILTGDVFKVDTPVNKQIPVWTGDGTIKGNPLMTTGVTDGSLILGALDNTQFGWLKLKGGFSGHPTIDFDNNNGHNSVVESWRFYTGTIANSGHFLLSRIGTIQQNVLDFDDDTATPTLPTSTIANINARGIKAIATKEYVDSVAGGGGGSINNITEIPNRSYNDLQDLPTIPNANDFVQLDENSPLDIVMWGGTQAQFDTQFPSGAPANYLTIIPDGELEVSTQSNAPFFSLNNTYGAFSGRYYLSRGGYETGGSIFYMTSPTNLGTMFSSIARYSGYSIGKTTKIKNITLSYSTLFDETYVVYLLVKRFPAGVETNTLLWTSPDLVSTANTHNFLNIPDLDIDLLAGDRLFISTLRTATTEGAATTFELGINLYE